MDKQTPFPQADDFRKIVDLLSVPNEFDLSNNKKVSIVLGEVTDRQVMYYLSAASFLGLIEVINGEKRFTGKGNHLRNMNSVMREIELVSLVLQSPIFNKIYVFQCMIGKQTQQDVAEIIKQHYPSYSKSICERRAQTVLKWVEYITKKLGATI
jgi:hypothetical protein